MPKRPAGLPDGRMPWRDRFVERMTQWQDARGYSDAGLAERISTYHPMSAATVWKLKHAEPPRGVTLDEAMAIVAALGFDSVEQLLQSSTVAGVAEDRIQRAWDTLRDYIDAFPVSQIAADLKDARDALAEVEMQRPLKDDEVRSVAVLLAELRAEAERLAEVAQSRAHGVRQEVEATEDALRKWAGWNGDR